MFKANPKDVNAVHRKIFCKIMKYGFPAFNSSFAAFPIKKPMNKLAATNVDISKYWIKVFIMHSTLIPYKKLLIRNI